MKSYYEVAVYHFQVANSKFAVPPIAMMIDSGTTFTHFPNSYIRQILDQLNDYCSSHSTKCGRIPGSKFQEDSCLELKLPDDNYSSPEQLIDSFPLIKIFVQNHKVPYVLHPKNYFYREIPDDPSTMEKNTSRVCLALKGHEDGKIILGAFSMIDYYFYFDRKAQKLKIYKEDCFLRARELL